MHWFIASLLSALILSFGQICIKKGLSSISPLWNTIIDAGFSLLLYLGFTLVSGVRPNIGLTSFLTIVLISGLYIFFYYAIDKGKLAIAGTIFSSYPIITIILSFLILHERLSELQICMMVIVLFGVVFLSYEKGAISRFTASKYKTMIYWAVFGAIATGVGDFLAKSLLNHIDLPTYMFNFAFAFALSTGIFWLFDKNGRLLPKKLSLVKLRYTIIGTVLLSSFVLVFNYALSVGKASLVTTTSSSYVAMTAILAYFLLHERLSARQIIGVIFVSTGVLFMGVM